MLSCDKRCDRRYLDVGRWHLYGAASATNYLVGYRHKDHPQANLDYYQSTMIESMSGNPAAPITCDSTYGGKDLLGFCDTVRFLPGHRWINKEKQLRIMPTPHPPDTAGNVSRMDAVPAFALFAGACAWPSLVGNNVTRYIIQQSAETTASPFYYSEQGYCQGSSCPLGFAVGEGA